MRHHFTTYEVAKSLLAQVQQFKREGNSGVQLKAATEGQATFLYLRDWTARVCNSCDADVKAIDAFYTIFLTCLKALQPELMEGVTVWRQSDAILQGPSNCWISVINVGRHFNLNQVMGSNLKDADGVGSYWTNDASWWRDGVGTAKYCIWYWGGRRNGDGSYWNLL